jgi:nucleoside-diphosphate-sugar epimerase
MKVLITGGSGFIGRALTKQLVSNGYSVRILTRKLNNTFHDGVEIIKGDLVSENNFSHIVSGCHIVINCAGEVRDVSKMRSLHVGGTEKLLRAFKNSAAIESAAKHWIQLSSVGAYGAVMKPGMLRVVTEETPDNPQGEYEVTKTLADQLVINHADDLLSYSILRPTNVVGSAMPNQSFAGLVRSIKKRLFFYIASRDAIATYVHVDDVVTALIFCLEHPNAKNQIFNLSNDCKLSEIVERIAKEQKKSTNFLCLPEWHLRMLARILKKTGKWPLTESRIDALISQTRYPITKLETLGFKTNVSIPDFAADYSKLI